MHKIRPKRIGVIGGMGHKASAYFYSRFVDRAKSYRQLMDDTDYADVIMANIGLEGFDATGSNVNRRVHLRQLHKAINWLNFAEVERIYIPCNTVYPYLSTLQNESDVPLINPIHITVDRAEQVGMKKVGLWASRQLIELEIYQTAIMEKGIEPILPSPNEQESLTTIIQSVIEMKNQLNNVTQMGNLSYAFRDRGVDGILLACTELPFAVSDMLMAVPTINSLDLLIESALSFSYGKDQ